MLPAKILLRVTATLTVLNMCVTQRLEDLPQKKVRRTGKYPLQVYSMYHDQVKKKSPKIVGEWSPWSPWSPCSRTCGGGITQQIRQCVSRPADPRFVRRQRRRRQSFGKNGCVGLYKRIHLCNSQDCPTTQDFRREQCAAFNNRPFKGKVFYWEPYYQAHDECSLNCRPLGMNFYATLNKTVIDGTPCTHPVTLAGKAAPKGTRGVCIDGYCKSVNSHGVIGSADENQEVCSACLKGSCRSINGIYTRPDLPAGYSLVAQIPQGACRILVQQLKHTRNVLALKTTNGSFIINGEWKFTNSKVFEAAGTKFTYVKQDENSLETISSPGPLASSVDLMIVNYQANPGIKYGYSLPIIEPTAIAPPLIKRPTFEYGSPDIRRLDLHNTTLNQRDEPKSVPHPGHRRTRLRRKYFHWKITGLTPCSKSCGGGTQTYIRTCYREIHPHNLIPVSEKRCAHLEPPPTIPCNTESCQADWQGDWGKCSATCGDGIQHYVLQCKQEIDGASVVVSDSLCPRTKPISQTRTCRIASCDYLENDKDNELPHTPEQNASSKTEWTIGPWSQCSVTCGTGHKTRSVICPSGQCHPENRPTHAEYCNMGPCDSSSTSLSSQLPPSSFSPQHDHSSWLFTEWSQCSEACGTGIQTRATVCAEDNCSSNSKPDTSRACSSDKQCSGKWFSGPWSECSDSCSGPAKQKREVFCIVKIRGNSHITNEMTCPADLKPVEEQPCAGFCRPQWFISEWGPCEGTCPIGLQRRQVTCMDISGRPSTACSEADAPISKRSCACQVAEESREKHKPVQDQPVDQSCVDKIRKCRLAVQARLCHYAFYKTNCCESCRKAPRHLLE